MKSLSNTAQRTSRNQRGSVSIEYMLTGMVVIIIALTLIPFIHNGVTEYIAAINNSFGGISVQ